VAFQPVRDRANRLANRLVYGDRATPYEVLARFGERVGETYASDDVLPRIARVIAEGTAAARSDVSLRLGDRLTLAASWPGAEPRASLRIEGDEPPPIEADRVAPVRHQAAPHGASGVANPSRDRAPEGSGAGTTDARRDPRRGRRGPGHASFARPRDLSAAAGRPGARGGARRAVPAERVAGADGGRRDRQVPDRAGGRRLLLHA